MQISVSDVKAQLTELVHRAEAGDKIVLTRHGQPVARLVPIRAAQEQTLQAIAWTAVRYLSSGSAACPSGTASE